MKTLKILLLWTWQSPQSLIGFFIFLFYRKKIIVHPTMKRVDGGRVYLLPSGAIINGCCFGFFIFLHKYNTIKAFKHEYGHVKQGYILGWLYLLVIGIPSFINNIISKVKNKNNNNDYKATSKWYFARYPEAWADRLGGVKR